MFLLTGTPALRSRGFIDEDFAKVAEYFDLAVKIALKIKSESQGKYINRLVFFLCVSCSLNYIEGCIMLM